MRHGRFLIAATVLACAITATASPADAAASHRGEARNAAPARTAARAPAHRTAAPSATRVSRGAGISCVPYARSATGMAISGNGGHWWYNAAGLYARGDRPEPGAVIAFPGSGGMRAGHVGVVERVVGQREITIHHANWGGPGIRRGSVMHGVSVVDVSASNDWTAVRVQAGHDNATFGRIYPLQGFIYNRPDPTGGTMMAGSVPRSRNVTVVEAGRSASLSELRGRYTEMAAAPPASPHARQHLDLTLTGLNIGR